MTLESALATYGYPVVFVGTFLEGETVLLLAGYAAHRGYLSVTGVLFCALLGTVSGDLLWYFMGRLRGRTYIERHPQWKKRFERVEGYLVRHELAILVGFRFIYGIRNAVPFAIGATGYSPAKFVPLNLLGGFIWSLTFCLFGFLFGHGMSMIWEDARRFEVAGLLALIVAGIAIWLFRRRPWRNHRQ